MYRTEPPTDKTIREWHMKFQQSGCLCAAKRRGRPLRFAHSTKKTLRDSLPIDMLLSALSFLVVAQSSSEVPEGLMNNPVQFIVLPLNACIITYLITYLVTYLLTYLLTYSLTHSLTHSLPHSLIPRSRVLLAKLASSQLPKNPPHKCATSPCPVPAVLCIDFNQNLKV